ncbi:MAG: citrate synthase [Eubacteriales bacterium]|nr:citrate synthase [Eubacteriales bacterium]
MAPTHNGQFNDDSILARYFGRSSNYTDIPNQLFYDYNVKKGLRNEDGTGVRIGLTRISDVVGYTNDEEGNVVPCEGDLVYRGYSIRDLIKNRQGNYGFEETCFLLLFGYLPDKEEFENFKTSLSMRYELPESFLANELLLKPAHNLMNKLQSAVLSLYNYDDSPDETDVYENLLKGINLIAKFPALGCYAYYTKVHSFDRSSLIIHYPRREYSIAENILYMLRPDGKFTDHEANLLDAILLIHADHGGGNNSTFTNVVVGSTGTDLYSALSASIGSLKGPKHGGANISVAKMMRQIIADTDYTADKDQLRLIIHRILDRDYYDRSGLVYGFGHAVYTLSDPRAEILRRLCRNLAEEQGCMYKFTFYKLFEDTVKEVIKERKGSVITSNVDLYSGLAYSMLGIPEELFTPLFATARVAGWVAHNLENKLYDGRIMRPATKYVGESQEFIPMSQRR